MKIETKVFQCLILHGIEKTLYWAEQEQGHIKTHSGSYEKEDGETVYYWVMIYLREPVEAVTED